MKRFSARQLHNNPQKVFTEAHNDGVVIDHRSHGDMLLISPKNIFSKHTHLDGSVTIHLKKLDHKNKNETPEEAIA